jgi:hypothetical protein
MPPSMRARSSFLAAAFLAALLTGCLHRKPKVEGFQAVVVRQEVKLLEQTLGGAKARYAASLLGPKAGATIDRAQWTVRYDGKEIAHGSQALNVPFDEQGHAPLVLVLDVPYAPTAAALAELDSSKKVSLELDGTFHFKHGLLYDGEGQIHFESQVVPPHLPRVRLARAEGARFDTGEAEVALTLEVQNPNDFPVVLFEAPYAVGLGDQRPSEGVALAGEPVRPHGVAQYPIRAYLDPNGDPDDRRPDAKVDYFLRGAVRGNLFDVRFDFDGTVKLRSGG